MVNRWIFLRGLTRGQGHWVDLPDLLRARVPNAEIEFLDLAGNGDRFRENSFTDTMAAAEDLRARSKLLKKGPVRMLAHSLGAMVAVRWMQKYPADFERLFLMNTSAKNLGLPWERFNLRNLPAWAGLARSVNATDRERITLSVICNNEKRVRELLPRMAAYTAEHPVRFSNAVRQLWSAARTVFPDQSPGSVAILVGGKDRLVAPANSIELARRWGVPARIHPWGGHDLAVDDPEWLVEQLSDPLA